MSASASRCLLLVEDDPQVRDVVALLLQEEGFEVVEAENAARAMQLVQEGLDPPLMVTDVDLGPGPSGAELADAMHRLRPELAIIFITGRGTSLRGRKLEAREAVLAKPFEVHTLSRLVREMTAAEDGAAA